MQIQTPLRHCIQPNFCKEKQEHKEKRREGPMRQVMTISVTTLNLGC